MSFYDTVIGRMNEAAKARLRVFCLLCSLFHAQVMGGSLLYLQYWRSLLLLCSGWTWRLAAAVVGGTGTCTGSPYQVPGTVRLQYLVPGTGSNHCAPRLHHF